jgi:RNA polymerase sigma-54 factor
MSVARREVSMNMQLRPGLSLQQRMTPQLILLMKLLARPCLELREEIAEAVDDNPALEATSDHESAPRGPDPGDNAVIPDEARLIEHIYGGVGRDLTRVSLEPEPYEQDGDRFDRVASRSAGLAEHLLQQLGEEIDDERSRSIGEWLIGNLDASGFLDEDVASIATRLGVTPDDVRAVLARIQAFDPVGAGARDARECLLIQARVRFPDRPHLVSLIEHHLPELTARRYSSIARALGISVEEVHDEQNRLLSLNPRPARGFGVEAASYVVPDVRIFKVGSDFVVRVNDDGLPRLRVSPYYRRILRDGRDARPDEFAFARAKVAAATWFIKSIYERQRTIQKVTEAIVDRQRAFLEAGPEALRPMILRDIAGDVGLCESTVSRVTSRKYADTPQGVLELRYFFGTGIPGVGGDEIAPEAAKAWIHRIVAREDPAKPLSDQQIRSHLSSHHGVLMARRTVAKYREALGIGSSNQRRRCTDSLPGVSVGR